MHKGLLLIGALLILAGLLWPVVSKLPLGRLPGDIWIERENSVFYFPLTTSLIVSLLLSILFWLWRK